MRGTICEKLNGDMARVNPGGMPSGPDCETRLAQLLRFQHQLAQDRQTRLVNFQEQPVVCDRWPAHGARLAICARMDST